MPVKYDCVACKKQVTATKNQRYRSHTDGEGNPCEMGSAEIPEHILARPVGADDAPEVPREGVDFAVCHDCGRKVKLTRLGYFEHHTETLRGDVRCPVGGTRLRGEETVQVDPKLLGDPNAPDKPKVHAQEEHRKALVSASSADSGAFTGSDSPPPSKPTSTTSSEPSTLSEPETVESSGPTGRPLTPGRPLQPGYALSQPPDYVKAEKVEMTEKAKEITARFKEIFYSYTNRRTKDNRGAQKTLGPSEIGTPCDRRLAMSLMGVEPVNPGGDGWAAQVGTWAHSGLEEMFRWASANSGRFATEVRVQLPSKNVPFGTTDLIDRTAAIIEDFKLMGEYSLKKLREQGPPEHYRIQAHVYGLGATLAGEKIRDVAILGLPRGGSSLDQMYVWTEPFDRKVAEDALARVDRIAGSVQEIRRVDGLGDVPSPMSTAKVFSVGDDCRYCPFHLKADKEMQRGCPGV